MPAQRGFFYGQGTLDKIYRITEFFGWGASASEARLRVGLQSILRAAAWGVGLIERRICGGNVADGKNKPLS